VAPPLAPPLRGWAMPRGLGARREQARRPEPLPLPGGSTAASARARGASQGPSALVGPLLHRLQLRGPQHPRHGRPGRHGEGRPPPSPGCPGWRYLARPAGVWTPPRAPWWAPGVLPSPWSPRTARGGAAAREATRALHAMAESGPGRGVGAAGVPWALLGHGPRAQLVAAISSIRLRQTLQSRRSIYKPRNQLSHTHIVPSRMRRSRTNKGTSQSGQMASVLANDAGIRGEFSINDHPHGFVLAISAGENNMVRGCEWFEFDASTAFWTGHSKRKREPRCPMRP